MKKLDFMIVGAQKSGTTALAEFLGCHTGIAISDPKIAPNEPPAIIKPYSFLDLLSLNKLITNTQNIETTKKAYI